MFLNDSIQELITDTSADVGDLNDKGNSMFMNVTDANELGKI